MTKVHKLPHQHSLPWWRWILIGLTITALFFSILLSWHYLKGGTMPGCGGGGSSCDQVLNSRWSTIAGVLPVSSLAVGAYLAILISGFFIGPSTEGSIRKMAWSVMLILSGSIVSSAIWFFILQQWIIGDFCPYCMSTHITGILLTALVIWRSSRAFNYQSDGISEEGKQRVNNISAVTPGKVIQPLRTGVLILSGFVLTGILISFQNGFSTNSVYTQGRAQETLPRIDYKKVPMIGSPGASHIITLLFDYECPHCQKIHFMLNDVALHYKGKVAFALCPSPLNSQCNPYIPQNTDAFKNSCELSRIGLAVWLASRTEFPSFENWMFTYVSGNRWHPRSLEAARAMAEDLVGKKELETALNNPWIDQYIQTCINIYGQTLQGGKGGVPKLIYGSHWVIPEANTLEELMQVLLKSFNLRGS